MDKREYKEISALAANGDTKAFAHLYETIYREMYYTAYYTLADDADAVDVVMRTVKDGFSSVGKLRTEEAFRTFMMKSLCSRIKARLKEYPDGAFSPRYGGSGIKREFERLSDSERLVAAMYVAGRFIPSEIAAYAGMSAGGVKKRLKSVLEQFELD
ncbi:MAG: hypothetical protein ACI4XA_08120 [Oscillospiraceae bacterium]